MHIPSLLAAAGLLAAAAAAQAQAPQVGEVITFGSYPSPTNPPLLPRPIDGTERPPLSHDITRATQAMAETCQFTQPQIKALKPQKAQTYQVLQVVTNQRHTATLQGAGPSKTVLWVELQNVHRPSCRGWWDRGQADSSMNTLAHQPQGAQPAALPATAGPAAAAPPAPPTTQADVAHKLVNKLLQSALKGQ